MPDPPNQPPDDDKPPKPVPAAQYIRMSTEHQQYSTANQQDVIRDYAKRRGFEIVRTFADEGKSGLCIAGREALRQLIEDAQSGKVDFAAILVYDVSRWGRFQDADESAYYEYLCKRAGIEVHYCAEQFENDGGPDRRYGKVVFIASVLSIQGGINVASYAASKGGIKQLISALANEWAAQGVNVNGIAPGYVESDLTSGLQDDATRSRAILERIPAGRWGTPDDVVGSAVFLCSDAATYVHGTLLVVDGGWLGR